MDVAGTDRLWIGNLGRYGEGALVGAWLALPFDERDLARFLEERCGVDGLHEEVAIFDTDFGGPLGRIGFSAGELDSISDVNLLSRVLDGKSDDDLAAIGAYVRQCGVSDPIEVANVAAQRDEILWTSWDGSLSALTSPEERLGYWFVDDVLGGPGEIDADDLEEHFDYEAYARTMLCSDLRARESGHEILWTWSEYDADIRVLDAGELHDRASELAGPGDGWYARGDVERAREIVERIQPLDMGGADDRALLDAALVIDGLTSEEVDSISFYCDVHDVSSLGPLELGSMALQVDDVPVNFVPVGPGSLEERLGRDLVSRYGLPSDASLYFDYESYGGQLVRDDGFVCFDDGVLDACSEVDADLYSRSELRDMADGRSEGSSRLDSLEAECLSAAAIGVTSRSMDRGER